MLSSFWGGAIAPAVPIAFPSVGAIELYIRGAQNNPAPYDLNFDLLSLMEMQ